MNNSITTAGQGADPPGGAGKPAAQSNPDASGSGAWSERLRLDPSRKLLGAVFWTTAIFLAWASLFKLDQVTRAHGRVAPGAGTQTIQHLEGGIVTELLVKEGERVRREQPLMRLANQFTAADFSNARTEVAALQITLARLEAETTGTGGFGVDPKLAALAPEIAAAETDLFQSRMGQLRQDLSVVEAQVQSAGLEASSLEARLESLRSEEKVTIEQLRLMERALAVDAISAQEVLDKRNSLQQLRTRISDVATEIPQARARATEAQARKSSIRAKFLAEAEQKAAEVRLAMSKAEQGLSAFSDRQTRTEIRAPVDGVVNRIFARTIGGVVRGGDPIMEITPIDSTIVIEARLSPKDRADVWPGQSATVKVSAFDYSVFGGLEARVVDISPDALQDERGESYFRVRLTADASNLGPENAVSPGMTADVDIKSGRRTVLDYLLAPIEDAAGTALRE
jgi:adhesin transport system membrane fusion protein